jgi:hypothetical protein
VFCKIIIPILTILTRKIDCTNAVT